jgi:hypothetical protein
MLVPGEYLIVPVPAEPNPQKTTERVVQSPPAPKAEAQEPEGESFLLILLRALGAVHT